MSSTTDAPMHETVEGRLTVRQKSKIMKRVSTPGHFRSRRTAYKGTRDMEARPGAGNPHQAPVRWLVAAAQRDALGIAFAISLAPPRRDGSVMLTRHDLSAWEINHSKVRPALVRLQAAGMLRLTHIGDAFRIRPNYLAVPRS